MVFSSDLINFDEHLKLFHLLSVTDFQSTMSNHVPWLALKRAGGFPWRLASSTSTMFLSYFTPFTPRGSPRVLIFFFAFKPSSISDTTIHQRRGPIIRVQPIKLAQETTKARFMSIAFYWLIHKSRAWLSRVTGSLSQFHREDSCLEFDISLLFCCGATSGDSSPWIPSHLIG